MRSIHTKNNIRIMLPVRKITMHLIILIKRSVAIARLQKRRLSPLNPLRMSKLHNQNVAGSRLKRIHHVLTMHPKIAQHNVQIHVHVLAIIRLILKIFMLLKSWKKFVVNVNAKCYKNVNLRKHYNKSVNSSTTKKRIAYNVP